MLWRQVKKPHHKNSVHVKRPNSVQNTITEKITACSIHPWQQRQRNAFNNLQYQTITRQERTFSKAIEFPPLTIASKHKLKVVGVSVGQRNIVCQGKEIWKPKYMPKNEVQGIVFKKGSIKEKTRYSSQGDNFSPTRPFCKPLQTRSQGIPLLGASHSLLRGLLDKPSAPPLTQPSWQCNLVACSVLSHASREQEQASYLAFGYRSSHIISTGVSSVNRASFQKPFTSSNTKMLLKTPDHPSQARRHAHKDTAVQTLGDFYLQKPKALKEQDKWTSTSRSELFRKVAVDHCDNLDEQTNLPSRGFNVEVCSATNPVCKVCFHERSVPASGSHAPALSSIRPSLLPAGIADEKEQGAETAQPAKALDSGPSLGENSFQGVPDCSPHTSSPEPWAMTAVEQDVTGVVVPVPAPPSIE
uniref:Uncharacterized protein LOC117364377 isoform X2 n=1 Tax=Geotrypetes seraphini TaxID=260995 RepID=A0A6P8RXM1_GEOSA|nr:uncharacterized protein LOC117364377 isoform X2 [Geotrypetes seraphini]